MIIARYERDGDSHNLSVNGHAGYANKGQDIVCSGVSAIVYALIAFLENHEDEAIFVSIDEGNGEVIISCDGDEKMATAFYMAAIGIENIANTYPAHVSIDIVGIAD